jgi:isopenicillin N synthase-like dioxygenase
MIVKSSLDSLPRFPDDVPTAPIASASLSKLLADDDAEAGKVLEACRTHGFFYLDMRGCPEGEALLDESEQLLQLATETFNRPLEEKQKFALKKGVSLYGYKEAGVVKQTDKDKRPDSTEFFNIAKDHVHGIEPSREYLAEIEAAKPLIRDFTKNAHECGMVVLRTLARQLDLPQTTFTDKNLISSSSCDHCRLTHKTPHVADKQAIGLPSHTDFGSITVLFNWLGGLQIQSRDPSRLGEWEYVKPLPGHAIINLGDSMVIFTNGELKSAKHRVVPAPGEQVNVDRYSVVYFVRPANEILMKPVDRFQASGQVKVAGKFYDEFVVGEKDKVFTSKEWMDARAKQMGS